MLSFILRHGSNEGGGQRSEQNCEKKLAEFYPQRDIKYQLNLESKHVYFSFVLYS